MGYAIGSANEVEYQLLLSRDLGLMGIDIYEPLAAEVVEVRRMLVALSRKLSGGS